ncbi:MAG: hypothetical protein ACOVOD_08300 [Rhodoferax sp.]
MKISRLFQPPNPSFWLVVVLNLLSTALIWIVRTYPLTPVASVLIAFLAIGNAALGAFLMWRLVKS